MFQIKGFTDISNLWYCGLLENSCFRSYLGSSNDPFLFVTSCCDCEQASRITINYLEFGVPAGECASSPSVTAIIMTRASTLFSGTVASYCEKARDMLKKVYFLKVPSYINISVSIWYVVTSEKSKRKRITIQSCRKHSEPKLRSDKMENNHCLLLITKNDYDQLRSPAVALQLTMYEVNVHQAHGTCCDCKDFCSFNTCQHDGCRFTIDFLIIFKTVYCISDISKKKKRN